MSHYTADDKLIYNGSYEPLCGAHVLDLAYHPATDRYTLIVSHKSGAEHALRNVRHESLRPYSGFFRVVK